MDPLSISMAIISTIGATKATIQAARSLWKAPQELDSLQNDLSDAELMIRDIKSYTEDSRVSTGENQGSGGRPINFQEEALRDGLVEAELIVTQLKALILKVLETPDDPTSVRRVAWLRAKKETRKLGKNLARIHEEMARRYGQARDLRITLGLNDISNVQIRLENQVQANSRSVSQLGEALLSSQQLQDQTISSVQSLRQDTSERLRNLESAILTSHDLIQRLPEILTLQIQTSQQSIITSSTQSGYLDDQISEATTNTRTSTIHSTYGSVMIRSRYQYPNSCELSCHCRCHFPRKFESPSFLSNLLGRMFIGYKGLPGLASNCTDERCKRDNQPKVYITYFFPQWWLTDRIMMLLAQWTIARGPELLLRFPRVVGITSMVFKFAHDGNIEGLKLLFNSGEASPNDLESQYLIGPLTHAFDHRGTALNRHLDVVKFLIQAGADTQREDSLGKTFEDRASVLAFSGRSNSAWQQWAMEMFGSRRSQYSFSNLHEIVLGLRHTSLNEEISKSTCPEAIDVQDAFGNTPLMWAANRGDSEAVCQLLRAGANPEIFEKRGRTPLLGATRNGYLDCVLNLLSHGANPHSCTDTGSTVLHYICAYAQPSRTRIVECLDTLFNMGIDINAQVYQNGVTALIYSLLDPNHDIHLRWLLENGADHRIKTSNGSTILHAAGEYGDFGSVQILRDAHLSDIDIHGTDTDTGLTAMDELLAPHRVPPASEELKESFQLLLDEIEARTNGLPFPVPVRKSPNSTSSTVFEEISNAVGSAESASVDLESESESEDGLVFEDSVEY